MNYQDFLLQKSHLSGQFGFDPIFMPDYLFDFQKYVAEYAIKKGRAGIFLDTGLGKTIIELVIAINHIKKTNKPVLIITPLAVAFQFIREAGKFDIDDIMYSRDGKYNTKIVICNYERIDKFNSTDFDCVLLDESSILKNFKGIIKGQITSFLKQVKYRYLFTASPSPNDFTELGTSSEALGYMGYTDMLTKFYTNNEDTISPMNIGTKWLLKGHAKDDFFKWVSSWSISMRKPSDLGFDDTKFILPELVKNYYSLKNTKLPVINGQYQMYNIIAKTRQEIQFEIRNTIRERCEKAVELASNYESSVYWCNLNPEGDLLQELDKDAYQITGSMDIDKKEEILLSFLDGKIKKLVTKARMTAFGLNWQHCWHTVFFPTYSFEQFYQGLRRFWRFGQTHKVIADLVYSDGQKRVLDGLTAKAKKSDELFSKLNSNLNSDFKVIETQFNKEIQTPKFI